MKKAEELTLPRFFYRHHLLVNCSLHCIVVEIVFAVDVDRHQNISVFLTVKSVVVVSFSEFCTVYFTHGRHGGVELQIRDGDGSWPKTGALKMREWKMQER